MDFEYFISRRIRSKKGSSFSRPIIKVSIAGIALGLAVMLVSVAILKGFQQQIREKVVGFGAHIQITGFDSNNSFEPTPISLNEVNIQDIRSIQGVQQVQAFGLKAGIIKTDNEIQGVVFKGVDKSYEWKFFKDRIVEGKLPKAGDSTISEQVVISRRIAEMLHFGVGDDLRMYFIIDNTARGRKFNICGIYDTGLGEFDETYIFGDIGHIRKLNQWNADQVSGVEVIISDFSKLDKIADEVYQRIGYKLNTQTIRQLYPQIFDWVEIQDLNVMIILILMALVSGITIISTLLILILEHTRDIGLLKALGAADKSIRKIFIYASVYITGYGLLWGNVVALALIFIQKKTGIIPLPAESYFVSEVPVSIGVSEVLVINAAALLVCTLMMLIPSMVIRYISPVKAMRFD